MSTRSPVVLIRLPNVPYFLGTFDTTNFQNWWRSEAFPDNIEFIKKGFHIFGRTHLAIAKRTDGRWAIYRSKDYGIHWERVFLASVGEVIYESVIIKFGWAIINTSLGFYETVNAGTDWTLVLALPDAPNAPALCNIGGGDILLCTDGRYVWRSTDKARSWTQTLDQNNAGIVYKYYNWPSAPYQFTDWRGSPRHPCIAGANGVVIVSNGPFLNWSYDGGLTWKDARYWNSLPISWWPAVGDHSPPRSVVFDRFPSSATGNARFIVKQILVTTQFSERAEDVSFLVRCDDIDDLGLVRVFQSYEPPEVWQTSGPGWKYKYQQFLSPDENVNQISAFELPVTGTDRVDKLVFSAQTKIVNGVSVVSLKYSKDGGVTWFDLDTSSLRVWEGDVPVFGGSFLDDSYAKNVWVYGQCDNEGYWNYETGERTQCQSYEMDMVLEGEKTLTTDQKVDAIVVKKGEINDSVDAIAAKDQSAPYDVDGFIEGPNTKTYRIDRGIEDEVERTESVDAIMAKDQAVDDTLDALIQKNQRLLYRVAVGLHDQNSKSYLLGVKIVTSGLIKRLSRIERLSPQMLDLYLPYVPYNPYDSAWEYL